MHRRMLIADRNGSFLMDAKGVFEEEGFEVYTACDLTAVCLFLEQAHFSVVVVELRLQDPLIEGGAGVLLRVTALAPCTPVIIITDFPSVQDVRDNLGPNPQGPPAADFISKDEGMKVLRESVRHVVHQGAFPVAVPA